MQSVFNIENSSVAYCLSEWNPGISFDGNQHFSWSLLHCIWLMTMKIIQISINRESCDEKHSNEKHIQGFVFLEEIRLHERETGRPIKWLNLVLHLISGCWDFFKWYYFFLFSKYSGCSITRLTYQHLFFLVYLVCLGFRVSV